MTGNSGGVMPRTVPRAVGQLQFSLLAMLVGAVAGSGAVLFRGLIALIHNGLFLGTFSVVYDANVHTPSSPWGALVILVPVVGAVGVAFLVKTFAPEAKGHGVPEVIDAIYAFEDFFEKRVKGSYYRQHILGMFAIGLMLYGFMAIYGHYYIGGVGYATIQDLLSNDHFPLYLVLILFGAKLLATSLTLGSGASGGVFSPGLFLGATAGTAYGMILHTFFPAINISLPAFAVAGMAGMIGGATGAAVATIVMIFEMTLDYNVIIPMTLVVAISYGVRVWLCKESIYTMKLTRRGHYLSGELRAGPHLVKRAGEIMERRIGTIAGTALGDEMAAVMAAQPTVSLFLVTEQDRVIGFMDATLMLQAILQTETTAGQLAGRHFVTVHGDTPLEYVIAAMHNANTRIALVTDGSEVPTAGNVTGIVTQPQLAEAMINEEEFFLD
ncbi:MAG TPA: chloride channel protein [Caldilineaceae bacterium]|nr:chloride channel protein [Caldilineaceae bacterium]